MKLHGLFDSRVALLVGSCRDFLPGILVHKSAVQGPPGRKFPSP